MYVASQVYSYVYVRGVPISKLTDIPVTDISAIKSTNSDTDTNITTPMDSSLLLLQMLQIYNTFHYCLIFEVILNCSFNA